MSEKNITIGVIGLGYVGLPIALAFAKKYKGTIGYDICDERIAELKSGKDRTREVFDSELTGTTLKWTSDIEDLRNVNFFVVCVPTPVDIDKRPDLSHVVKGSELVSQVVSKGAIIVYESTVYPGVTEEICGPIIEKGSGLKRGKDFFLGYSPERINPGDKEHSLEKIVKVVSAENDDILKVVSKVYSSITEAGVFEAASIKVAEAAKVIENTQRDLNIALMNELAIIFDKMNISTRDVLAAAGTKWNFLKFSPGLVGGHCIGVDPYYLTVKAEQVGHHPEVILSGRRINDLMGKFIAQKAVKLLIDSGVNVKGAKIGVLGITFKENVSDIRNSRVPDIIAELKNYGADVLVHDPLALNEEVKEEYGITLVPMDQIKDLDLVVVAVAHKEYISKGTQLLRALNAQGVVMDVKSILDPKVIDSNIKYWCF